MTAEVTYIIMDTSTKLMLNTKMIKNQYEGLRTYVVTKIQSNPENTVGVISMGDDFFGVLASHTRDYTKILYYAKDFACFGGAMQLGSALHMAFVSLCRSAPMKRRVVVFAGGDLTRPMEVLVRIGYGAKMESIALDVVQFGSDDKDARLEAMVAAANNDDNSHFLHVPPGSSISDILLSDPTFVTGVSLEKEERVSQSENKEDDSAYPGHESVNYNESVVYKCGGESVNVEEKVKCRRFRGRDKRPGKGRKGRGKSASTQVNETKVETAS